MLHNLSNRLRRLLTEASQSSAGHKQSPRSREPRLIRLPYVAAANRDRSSQNWPQRLLIKQGARMHATSVERGDSCAIAMLDSHGVVVAWHDSLPDAGIFDHRVVGTHVSQFYLADDEVFQRADRRLVVASIHGSDTREGWCRRPNGSIFWGITVIEAMQLKSGQLHGYSHVTRYSRDPCERGLVSVWQIAGRYSTCSGAAA